MYDNSILTFFILISFMVIAPGPNFALLLKTVNTSKKSSAYYNVLGIVVAFYIHGTFSYLGISTIIVSSAKLYQLIKYAGAMYLAYLGIKSIISVFKSSVPSSNTPSDKARSKSKYSYFFEGLITNILNPKVSVFYLAAFPQFIDIPNDNYISYYKLVMIHASFAALWFSFVVYFMDKSMNIIKSSKFNKVVQATVGSVLLWFSYKVISSK